jgi:hypothetical protein
VQPMEVVPSYTPRHPPVRQATWSGKVVVLHFQTPPHLRSGYGQVSAPSSGLLRVRWDLVVDRTGLMAGKLSRVAGGLTPPPTFDREADGTPT